MQKIFLPLVLLLIALGIVRSAVATRLDSFTEDEAYHIAAGVTYVRFHDFRINPEHPPLVKLWVGMVVSLSGFKIDALRPVNDKNGERDYTEAAVFLKNDPDFVQRRARLAMWVLNGVLLLALVFAAKRVFGEMVALGTLLFLLIDPTVAAHLPVVLTDLPVALTAATGILWAASVFRGWRWADVLACSGFMGLALASKHSAPVIVIGVVLFGVVAALRGPVAEANCGRGKKFLKLAVIPAGALVILWGFYGFRFAESPNGVESFNRPLATKISDLNSTGYRLVLTAMSRSHIVPRAYTWGFADTVHAGLEGRVYPQFAFGKAFEGKAPWYFFPAMLAVKLPIGLLLLSLAGIVLYETRWWPAAWNWPTALLLAMGSLFLLVLMRGSTYAGIRHALPVVVLLALFGGMAFAFCWDSSVRWLRVAVVLAYVAAGLSALPIVRPWEYFNELVGGPQNAWKYFSDEGVDGGQRNKEIAAYLRGHAAELTSLPEILYFSSTAELKARGIDYLGRDMERDFAVAANPHRTGLIFAGPVYIEPKAYWDRVALRNATPVARFGNLFVYSGEFYLPGSAALTFSTEGYEKLFGEKQDLEKAEKAFRAAAEFDEAAYYINVELGNVCVMRGERDKAMQAYGLALKNVRGDEVTRAALQRQMEMVATEDLKKIATVRDPQLE